jgi:hypothetical protein
MLVELLSCEVFASCNKDICRLYSFSPFSLLLLLRLLAMEVAVAWAMYNAGWCLLPHRCGYCCCSNFDWWLGLLLAASGRV